MIRNIYDMVRELCREIKKRDISAFAGSMAFFLFLSLIPMLVVLCMLIPYTPLTEQNLAHAVLEVVPDFADSMAIELISEVYQKSAGFLSVAVVTTLWSAGKAVLALRRGLNAINDREETRNYFVVRVVASLYTVVILLAVLLSLFIMVFGDRLTVLLLYRVPRLQELFSFLLHFRFLAVWAILILLFASMYAYIPDQKQKWRDQIPGASFTAVVWSVFSWGFSLFVETPMEHTIYGILSILVVVMLWMYVCMYLILLGAFLNRYLKEKEIKKAAS